MAELFHVCSWDIGRVQVRHYWMMRHRVDALTQQVETGPQAVTRANGKRRRQHA